MAAHPGGNAHTRYLIALTFPQPGSRWLELGAGNGSSLTILKKLGHSALGIDPRPLCGEVAEGSLLDTPFPDGSFDCILSQCAFLATGDVPGALKEAARLLPKGGKLAYSDITDNPVQLLNRLRTAGFAVRHMEEVEKDFKAFFPKIKGAPWLPDSKNLSYLLLICERM